MPLSGDGEKARSSPVSTRRRDWRARAARAICAACTTSADIYEGGGRIRAEQRFDDVDAALWGVPQDDADPPTGAAAAFAIVAVLSFGMGAAVAAVLLLV
jgi:hypothetical protein